MLDYHAEQMTGSKCQGRNCAAASGAMGLYFGTRGQIVMTADSFRNASGVSCIPGKDTPSGGLSIPAIEAVYRKANVDIEYGRAASSFYRRWTTTEIKARLGTYYGAVLLGMYSNVLEPWRANTSFGGGHSVWAHDYRTDRPDTHAGKVQPTFCWHDPLRKRGIRVPEAVVVRYTQSSSPIKGFAGFVKIPPVGSYAHPMPDRVRTNYATLAVHSRRTTGAASTIRVIKGKDALVELRQYAEGQSWHGETTWGSLSLLDEWVNLGRVRHEGGDT